MIKTVDHSQKTVNYYDSLIRIDGNVDPTMLSQVEELGKALLRNRNFVKGAYNSVSNQIFSDARKSGIIRGY